MEIKYRAGYRTEEKSVEVALSPNPSADEAIRATVEAIEKAVAALGEDCDGFVMADVSGSTAHYFEKELEVVVGDNTYKASTVPVAHFDGAPRKGGFTDWQHFRVVRVPKR